MSADQITVILVVSLVVLLVILVANLAIMAAVMLGARRRATARASGPDAAAAGPAGVSDSAPAIASDGSATIRGEPSGDAIAAPGLTDGEAAVARRIATFASAAPAASAPPPEAAGVDDDAVRAMLVDRTTGLDSRLAWERALRDEDARQARYRRPVTVVILELEGLDRLTGRLGLDVADRILVAVAGTIRANARLSDRAAVLGSGRFGVLLPETDEIQAVNFVERVRSVCDLWLEASGVSVRALFGWASPGPGADLRTARHLAEERLDRDRRQPAAPRAAEIVPEPAPTGGPDDGHAATGGGELMEGGVEPRPEAGAS